MTEEDLGEQAKREKVCTSKKFKVSETVIQMKRKKYTQDKIYQDFTTLKVLAGQRENILIDSQARNSDQGLRKTNGKIQ